MITQTPAHFGGFSKDQLAKEISDGIKRFNEYSIQNIGMYLKNLNSKDFDEKKGVIVTTIRELISKDPFVALSQLNELFLRIEKNTLVVPKNYWGPKYNVKFLNQISSNFQAENSMHEFILQTLKQLYYENAITIKDSKIPILPDHFMDMLSKHDILKDKKYSYGKSEECDLAAAIKEGSLLRLD